MSERTAYDDAIDALGLAREFYRAYGDNAEAQWTIVTQYANQLFAYYSGFAGVPLDLRARCLREALSRVTADDFVAGESVKHTSLAQKVYTYITQE